MARARTADLDEEIRRIKCYEAKFGCVPADRRYSMGYWLKRYLGIPTFIPLDICMDHGAPICDTPITTQLCTELPIFVTNRNQQLELWKRYSKRAFVMGSPFVYCRRLSRIEQDPYATGTIAFPVHSTHLIEVLTDWDAYAESLLKLPPHFHPISVCMYWKDLLAGHHSAFVERGIPVSTAGHMADRSFALAFYRILRTARYSTSNLLGSYTLYSIEMGIPFFLYGELPLFNNAHGDRNRPQGIYGVDANPELARLQQSFIFDLSKPIVISEAIRDLCWNKLGLNEINDKRELRHFIYMWFLKIRYWTAGNRLRWILKKLKLSGRSGNLVAH